MSTAAIRTAIAEVLEGTIGSLRAVPSGTFLRGVFDGQAVQARKALTLQTSTARHWFDVQLGPVVDHVSTPVSATGNLRIALYSVVIRVESKLATQNQATQRAADIAAILDDCNTAARALATPGNLTQTSAGVATGIISGFLRGGPGQARPRVVPIAHDWKAQTAVTHIECEAIVEELAGVLDSMSASARSALVYAHWTGGRLLSSYSGSLFLARNATTGDELECSNTQQAIDLGAGTAAVLLAATRDQSGNGNHFAATAAAAMATLVQADGTQYATPDGSLAALLSTSASVSAGAYTCSGMLGLTATGAMELWYDMRGTGANAFVTSLSITSPSPPSIRWFGVSSKNDHSSDYGLTAQCFADNLGTDVVNVEFDDDVQYSGYIRVSKPANGTDQTINGWVNGTALSTRTVITAGTYTIADGTETQLYGYTASQTDLLACSAMLVFSAVLSDADRAIVDAFFNQIMDT